MKKLKLFLAAVILTSTTAAFAQEAPGNFSVRGTVLDSATQQPLDYVTVALKTQQNKPVKTTLSKTNGSFDLSKIAGGKYSVVIVSVGYRNRTIPVTLDAAHPAVNLGKIAISASSTALAAVTVTAEKPLVKQEVDRIGYDVQSDPENKVQNVLDMLRKVPLVTVDAEDNIQVKGSGSFKVLINGRPSSLIARSPKDVFKSMPANTIQKIEVITTPPAKYDSEGLAGIINIITSKKIDNGYNGSAGVRYGFPYGPGGHLNLSVKQGKFGFQTYGGINLRNSPATTSGLVREAFGAVPGRLEQNGRNKNKGTFGYGDVELSFEIDSLNLITASAGSNHGSNNISNSQFSNWYDAQGALNQSYRLNNDGDNGWTGYDLGVNYQLGFKRNKEQLLTGSYKYTKSADDQDNFLLNYERLNYSQDQFPDLHQVNSAGSKEHTLQLDYTHPLKNLNIEGGVKSILRNNFSDYQQFVRDYTSEDFLLNNQQSNNLSYQQNVYGLYNSYQLKLKKIVLKAGLRLEKTMVDANFKSTATTVSQDYANFIPSISIQRKFSNMSSVNFGYTERIERPGIWQLNPFVNRANPQSISYGNPGLHAVVNHSLEASYSRFKKGSVNIGMSYSFANNTIENVVMLGDDNISRQTFENVGKDRNVGSNISVNFPITKKLNLNVNGRLSYVWLEGVYNGQLFKNDGLQGNMFAYAGYRFDKGWRAGLNAGYFSPWVRLQGKANSSYFTSFSVNKEFLNKKATLSISASNPFSKFRRWENELNTANFVQSSYSNFYFRNMNVGFSYRFGKLKEPIKKNRRGINNDDVKGGGQGGAQGQ